MGRRVNRIAVWTAVISMVSTMGLPPSRLSEEVENPKDKFGITKIHLSPTGGGLKWESDWRKPRQILGKVDSEDSWFTVPDSNASYTIEDNELRISGQVPRMYIRDPALNRQWRDVEITMYFKRVRDSGTPYAGMVAVARSNHGATGSVTDNPCDSRGLGARLRADGYADFEKETAHPQNENYEKEKIWKSGGMPKNVWTGFKYIVYDLPNGFVKMELWMDQTEGRDGGQWQMVYQMTDDGNQLGRVPCAPGIDPRMPLTNSPDRAGSESGKPNLSVYFRSDGVGEDGLIYRQGSVREIEVK